MSTIVKNLNQSRREFLRVAGRLSIAGTAAPFALNLATIGAAAAQTANDYRALVCVFLYGANDHNNTVIPFDTASYASYSAARATIARPMSALLPLTPSVGLTGSNAGRQFALPTELGALRTIWDAGKLAIVANVGPLIVPTTKIQYNNLSVPLPPKLFSHNDQQSVWQASAPEGARNGWGGRIGDLMASQNTNSVFTCNSVSGSAVFLAGQSTVAYQVSASGTSSLAAQLRLVARMIAQRNTLGAKRQVFFVSIGGWDTHDDQLTTQPNLHAQVAGALSYFYDATVGLGISDRVTTFTGSDFGRTLTTNGDGSDHGWGSHHFVMGGAVKGQQYYGTFPIMGLNNNDEVGSGRLLPTTSVDQYAATLARWFGVSETDMRLVLPNIGNFGSSNVGFMNT